VLAALRHSRASGNPGDERHGDWMPAYAGMTFYGRRTYETDQIPPDLVVKSQAIDIVDIIYIIL